MNITTTGSSFNLNDNSNPSSTSSNNSFDNFFQDHVEDDHVIVYRRNSSLALNSLNAALGRKISYYYLIFGYHNYHYDICLNKQAGCGW